MISQGTNMAITKWNRNGHGKNIIINAIIYYITKAKQKKKDMSIKTC